MINLTFFSCLFSCIHLYEFLNYVLDTDPFTSRSYIKTSTCLCYSVPSSYSLNLYSLSSGFFSFVRRKWHQLIHVCTAAASLFLSQSSSSCRWYMVSYEWCCLLPQNPRHHNHINAQRLENLKNSLFSYYCWVFPGVSFSFFLFPSAI